MKQIFLGLAVAASASLCMISCSEDTPWSGSDEEGRIRLNLAADGRVMRLTRADDSLSPVVPHADSFSISLAKSDGSYSKTWASLPQFEKETAFGIGDYTLTASYGDIDKEGFDNPVYKGVSDVHVSPGELTEVNVTATLANSMVSIRYTDRFKENFKAYSAAVQTEGHDWVVFSQNETRPAYVAPCKDVKLNITLTNDQNQTVTVQPAGFEADARHHYVVTIDIEDSDVPGNLKLTVDFDDDVVMEKVDVNITDEFWTAPMPTLSVKGDPKDIEIFENAELSISPEFNVIAFGGISKACLNVISNSGNGYNPSFGSSVELIGAESLVQSQLSNEGIDCIGFFRKPDKMGVLNFKKFIERVPAGNYKITLEVMDAQTRVVEIPMEFTVKATEFEVQPVSEVELLATSLSVDVVTNNVGIKKNVKFRVPNKDNQLVDAEVKSITPVEDSSGSHRLRYVLGCEEVRLDKLNVEAKLGMKDRACVVGVIAPTYELETDAFATYVVVKVKSASPELTKKIANGLEFFNGETRILSSKIHYDGNDLIMIKDLISGFTYTSLKAKYIAFEKNIDPFTTEAAAQVPNGDFSQTSETINFRDIKVGGDYAVNAPPFNRDYRHKSSIVRSEANGWTSLNSLTCFTNSSCRNTWFMVPSTFVDNGMVIIRTVGYNHAGIEPTKSGGNYNTKYYCENSPSDDQLLKKAGELFLGSYSFDGVEHRTDGIDFVSRPSSISFQYMYTPVNNEEASVVAKVLDAEGNVIGSKSITLRSANDKMYEGILAFSDYGFCKKAAKLILCFKSSSNDNPGIIIPTGSKLNENQSLGSKTIDANAYHAFAKGSELIIDNVVVNY